MKTALRNDTHHQSTQPCAGGRPTQEESAGHHEDDLQHVSHGTTRTIIVASVPSRQPREASESSMERATAQVRRGPQALAHLQPAAARTAAAPTPKQKCSKWARKNKVPMARATAQYPQCARKVVDVRATAHLPAAAQRTRPCA